MGLLQAVVVSIDIEFLEEAVQQDLPVGLAVGPGGSLEAVAGVVAAYPQDVTHGVPEFRGAVEIERFILQGQRGPEQNKRNG